MPLVKWLFSSSFTIFTRVSRDIKCGMSAENSNKSANIARIRSSILHREGHGCIFFLKNPNLSLYALFSKIYDFLKILAQNYSKNYSIHHHTKHPSSFVLHFATFKLFSLSFLKEKKERY